MTKLTVDGTEVEVPAGASVLQACEAAGVEIPRFCYHERLSVAGNCRMCLVEVEKAPKPVASCAYPVADGMVVKTDTAMVRNARRGVMEFLLINHPLDCPICDQGGECDLQDQAYSYGMDHSRYAENKRAVRDKNLGPLVKTFMTRCIHCTRCIRFSSEVAGIPEMGATSRGEGMEVGTYIEHALTTELSGNLIDICPVGALLNKPYSFVARPWELRKTDSIDVHDALGTNIRVDARGSEVLRVLPRVNEDVNEEWLADKSRFAHDGLKRRRLDRPWVRENGKLRPATWPEAFGAIASKLHGLDASKIGAVAGDLCDAESMFALQSLMGQLGVQNLDCRQDGAALDPARRDYWLFNTGIAGIDEADAILLVGSNPRRESPVLNARIRKRWALGGCPVAYVGPEADLTYRAVHLGDGPGALSLEGPFGDAFRAARKPMVIVGQGALRGANGAAVLAAAWALASSVGALREDWHGFNVLHTAAARPAALELGFVPGAQGKALPAMLGGGVELLWLLGADEFDMGAIGAGTFVVYQGHHGDRGAAVADVILPGAAYTEKNGTYMNTEGRVQRGYLACPPPGEAREDWAILRAFSAVLGQPLPFDSIDQLRARMADKHEAFATIQALPRRGCTDAAGPAGAGELGDTAFAYAVQDYYQTNPIARASNTMAECSRTYVAPQPAMAAE